VASTHLTPDERETVVLLSDGADVATVSTWQRPVTTRLEKNPLARKVEDMRFGSSVGAKFELPAWAVSFRSKRRTGGQGNPSALARARQQRSARQRSDEALAASPIGTASDVRSQAANSMEAGSQGA
jgi:hypothetical protein